MSSQDSQKLTRGQKKKLAKAEASTAGATTAPQPKQQGKDRATEKRIQELEEQLKTAVATIEKISAPSQGSQQWNWNSWSWWDADEPAAKWSRNSEWAEASWE